MPLPAGTRLGPYEFLSALGAGGIGEVYRARDTRLARDVAIKVLPEPFGADPDRLRRFEQEARAIAALNHRHICQLHDLGPGYLVLEYIDGELRNVLEIDANFPLALGTLGAVCAQQGRLEEALTWTDRASAVTPWAHPIIGQLAALLVRTGAMKRAEPLLEKLGSGQTYGAPTGLAVFHAMCGEFDRAADWAEQAIEERYPPLLRILGPLLRSSPRWPGLVKRMNLPVREKARGVQPLGLTLAANDWATILPSLTTVVCPSPTGTRSRPSPRSRARMHSRQRRTRTSCGAMHLAFQTPQTSPERTAELHRLP